MAKNTLADLDTTTSNNQDVLGQPTIGSSNANQLDEVNRAQLALLARFYADLGGVVTVGGSANAISITSASTYQTLESGIVLTFKASAANTGATTLSLDGLGAKAVRRKGDVALSAGDIAANGRYLVIYDEAYNSAAGAWVLMNPEALPTAVAGDILYRSASAWATLGKGAAAQVLSMNAGATAPEWTTPAAVNVQTFTASGTWTKPGSGTLALIRAWGGGGGGARGSVGGAGGAGYKELWVSLSSLGATETVTVGAGGTGKTSTDGNGGNGGDSSFGAWLTAYGGLGGGVSSPAGAGGITGGVTSSNGLWDGGLGSVNAATRGSASYLGGGGGSGSSGPTPGGASFAGGFGGGPGVAGSVPGGGGGSSATAGGAGGRGEVRVYVF